MRGGAEESLGLRVEGSGFRVQGREKEAKSGRVHFGLDGASTLASRFARPRDWWLDLPRVASGFVAQGAPPSRRPFAKVLNRVAVSKILARAVGLAIAIAVRIDLRWAMVFSPCGAGRKGHSR
jgi:hypothetical protein